MLASSIVALALSSAAVLAAPATAYKTCPTLTDVSKERFGRTIFTASDIMLSNPLKIVDDRYVAVSQTQALLNRDPATWAETPGVGLLLVPAAAASLGPLKLAITYLAQGAAPTDTQVTYVETVKGETCVVSGSETWTSVNAILNAEEPGKPLLDCDWATMEAGERYTDRNTEDTFEESVKGEGHYFSTISMPSDDPRSRPAALHVDLVQHFGVFVQQDPAYTTTTKIAVEYVSFDGNTRTMFAIANKMPTPTQQGEWNADVYSTGYCKMIGSETWAKINSVNLVI